MNQQTTSATSSNGESSLHDLFALTDEQILEIEPEAADAAPVGQPFLAVHAQTAEMASAKPSSESSSGATPESASQPIQQSTQAGMPVPQEPPAWLAAQMKDPWNGEEAKELWNGIQQAKQEAAAYRAAFATPEDARALKELYPGGASEARAAAERSRLLDEIDRAYFGAAGGTPEQTSVARAQLAQKMMREDPAAFREMVFAGLRALEAAGKGSGATSAGIAEKTVAAVFRPRGLDSNGPQDTIMNAPPSEEGGYMKSYAAFEKAANEDLERSVGAAIERTLAQALPNASRVSNASGVGAQHAAPLQARLSQAIRQDIESALKGDRQFGEQITQILSSRRFDNETRAQVVRLIGERAQQLVPGAARRVINDWTQTTLAAHRGNSARADATSARREVGPAVPQAVSPAPFSSGREEKNRGAMPRPTPGSPRVDYRKLSDEQILDL